jgi:hypothetical protein
MSLHPETYAIAQALTGYEKFSEEEYLEQWEAEVTYDRAKPCNKPPLNGSISKDKKGKLWCYWIPTNDPDCLEGWYEVPCKEDIEDYCLGSVAYTPGDDEVEPDHPDSWLNLLCLI